MSIEKKSLISTLKTTRKANAASSEPAAVTGKSAISTKRVGVSTKQISTKRAAVSTRAVLN